MMMMLLMVWADLLQERVYGTRGGKEATGQGRTGGYRKALIRFLGLGWRVT